MIENINKYTLSNNYSISLGGRQRWLTREVMVGDIGVGGINPIRVQSMTTTPTMDTKKTVSQVKRLLDVGCEIVRITAQGPKEAANLQNIRQELRRMGINIPLVADIHFNPNAAMEAVKHVEKIRINPGNFVDTKVFKTRDYSDSEYEEELQRIRNKFIPLVKELKSRHVAIRIGTNHGSLSDRIMNRYGDTPVGMVESALEFARICAEFDYHEIIFSMKASNPQVMVYAYRLLVAKMMEEGMNYPLHLGVTEAGDGEDGRVKSALGIGTLLEDGLGDTIRVSLTEEPEAEIPVAFHLLRGFQENQGLVLKDVVPFADPFSYQKRVTETFENVGSEQLPIFGLCVTNKLPIDSDFCNSIGFEKKSEGWVKGDYSVDWLIIKKPISKEEENVLNQLRDSGLKYFFDESSLNEQALFRSYSNSQKLRSGIVQIAARDIVDCVSESVFNNHNLFVLPIEKENCFGYIRKFADQQQKFASKEPVLFKVNIKDFNEIEMLKLSYSLGGPFLDGYGNGILVEADENLASIRSFVYTLFQSLRIRVSRTEYISCPSCGRTLFDLQLTTARIREKTGHLKGVKIAVMGCIVNGPGEMADADFGYVGSAPGKVNLYVGKELVKRGIDEKCADLALIELIKEHDRWFDPV